MAAATHALPAYCIATKTGMSRTASQESNSWRPGGASPAQVAAAVDASCEALGLGLTPDHSLFLWQLHHTDEAKLVAPGGVEASLAPVFALVRAGRVSHVGEFTATAGMLARAHSASLAAGAGGIARVQNEYSVWCREAEQERPPGAAASSKKGVLAAAAAAGATFIAYAPLGGLKSRRGERSLVADFPVCAEVASARGGGVSPHAVYLAYLLQRARRFGGAALLIVGARTAPHAADSVSAARLRLTGAEVAKLDAAWEGGKKAGRK